VDLFVTRMKIAIVTGSSKVGGLGFALCKTLLAQGFKVMVTGRREDEVQKAAKELGEDAIGLVLDVSSEKSMLELRDAVAEKFTVVDLIVNNAGINPKDFADKERMEKAFYIDKLDADEMLKVYRVNSLGPLLMVKTFKPLLVKSDAPKVIQISSWLGSVTSTKIKGHYGYTSSKNLLNMLNKTLANELRDDNIACISVNPGWVATAMGGLKATFSPDEAAANIVNNVITKLAIEDSGRFVSYDGADHPW